MWWETSPSELQGSVWCQLGAYVRVHVNLRVHVHLYIGASEVGGGIGLCAIAKALHISVPARTQQHLHAKLMQDSGVPWEFRAVDGFSSSFLLTARAEERPPRQT